MLVFLNKIDALRRDLRKSSVTSEKHFSTKQKDLMNKEAYKSIITKCWADPEFKRRLIADAAGTLRAEGIAVPEGTQVNVVENTAREFTFVIPSEPSELSDAALDRVSGGIYRDISYTIM